LLQNTEHVPEALRDHIKSALFITMKAIQTRHKFEQVFISDPDRLLENLISLLKVKNDHELTLNCLKQILVMLEKYEKHGRGIPLNSIRDAKLIDVVCTFLDITMKSDRL